MSLAEKITVNTRYTRSINLERDRGSLSIMEAYLPTSRGVQLLDEVSAAFGSKDQPRAWSLIGPYGCGKSSFGLFLHELLGDGAGQPRAAGRLKAVAAQALANESRSLAQRFRKQKPWCRVALTGSEESLPRRLLAALNEAGTRFWEGRPGRRPAVLEDIRRAMRQNETSDSQVLKLIDALQDALEKSGAGGLLIIIDELGKFLEHEARQGAGGVFLLQGLAERAFRGRKANLMLFVLLHQAFDLYARGMGDKLKNDWAKVQGRFQSISFVETTQQTLRILAAAFSNSLTEAERGTINRRIEKMARALGRAKALPSALEESEAAKLFAACYPLHPLSLLLLPVLCQRFAQNERTLFSYLGSREPHGFGDSLQALKVGQWMQPSKIYDYFLQNQPAVLADPLTHRRWAEVVTAVDRAEREATDRNEASLHLVKAIGLLNLAAGSEALPASESVLAQLFSSRKAFREALEHPLRASIVQFRKFSGEYRVWQGTDFNIDEQVRLESEKLGHFDLAAALGERRKSLPIVARKHSIQTGALRYFEVAYMDAQSCKLLDVDGGMPPRLLFFLAESGEDEAAFHQVMQDTGGCDVWALYRNGAALRAAIRDALALEGVQRGAQELASDPVAAREIKERLKIAHATERNALNALTSEPALSEWHWKDERLDILNRSDLQEEISRIMENIYQRTPTIFNELINRDNLSSQAAAARKKLLLHMLTQETEPGLGFIKYPPEKAIYRSVLEKGRLHKNTKKGWTFVSLGKNDPLNLRPLWNRFDALFAASENDPVSAECLMNDLAAPPIGLKRGVFPIIFLHYYLMHQCEIALYDDGAYAPKLTFEHLERMVRRPDLFTFQRFRIQGVRAALFKEYSKALSKETLAPLTVLSIAKPLTQFVLNLDDYTQKTRRLPETTIRVRQAFLCPSRRRSSCSINSPRLVDLMSIPICRGFPKRSSIACGSLRIPMQRCLTICGRPCASASVPPRTLPSRNCGLFFQVDAKGLKNTRWTQRGSRVSYAVSQTDAWPTTSGWMEC